MAVARRSHASGSRARCWPESADAQALTNLRRELHHLRDRAFGDAIEHAEQLCRLEPLNEEAWCPRIRCHAQRGERSTALQLYQQCAALLKKELGVQPRTATRMTYREVLDIDGETPLVPATPRSAVYPLGGRHAEWQALLAAWRNAAAGRPRMIVIRGEAEIGKTRVAEELVDWCGLKAIPVATARCYAGEGGIAYGPIAAWLKSETLRPCGARAASPVRTRSSRAWAVSWGAGDRSRIRRDRSGKAASSRNR